MVYWLLSRVYLGMCVRVLLWSLGCYWINCLEEFAGGDENSIWIALNLYA